MCRPIHSDFKSRFKWLESQPLIRSYQLSKMFRRPSLCHSQFPFLQSVSSFYCPIFGVHSSPVSAITGFAPSSAKRGRFLVNADPARALYLSVSLSGCRRQAPSSRENLLKLTGWTVAAASSPTFSAMSNCPRSRFCQLGTQIFGKRFSANNFCDRENQRSREVRLLSLINGWHRHDGESEDQVVLV